MFTRHSTATMITQRHQPERSLLLVVADIYASVGTFENRGRSNLLLSGRFSRERWKRTIIFSCDSVLSRLCVTPYSLSPIQPAEETHFFQKQSVPPRRHRQNRNWIYKFDSDREYPSELIIFRISGNSPLIHRPRPQTWSRHSLLLLSSPSLSHQRKLSEFSKVCMMSSR